MYRTHYEHVKQFAAGKVEELPLNREIFDDASVLYFSQLMAQFEAQLDELGISYDTGVITIDETPYDFEKGFLAVLTFLGAGVRTENTNLSQLAIASLYQMTLKLMSIPRDTTQPE